MTSDDGDVVAYDEMTKDKSVLFQECQQAERPFSRPKSNVYSTNDFTYNRDSHTASQLGDG